MRPVFTKSSNEINKAWQNLIFITDSKKFSVRKCDVCFITEFVPKMMNENEASSPKQVKFWVTGRQ